MKKSSVCIVAVILIAVLFSLSLTACNNLTNLSIKQLFGYEDDTEDPQQEQPAYLPLYDDDGIFLEENFAYNMALEKANGLTLIKDGSTDYVIVTATDVGQDTTWAAEDLATAFEGICGTKPAIVTDASSASTHEIVLGYTTRTPLVSVGSDVCGAYRIYTESESIYILGENETAIANGVYGFMEDTLGCVFLTEDETYYPSLNTAIVEPIDEVWEPDFEYRDVGFACVWYNDHYRNKLRSDTSVFSSDGCHKSLSYIAGEILEAHPEYYAELGGERRSESYMFQLPQLCFSNPEVIDLLEEGVLARINSYDGDQEIWWDISQQDSMNLCQCERCTELCSEYKSNIAPMLYCLNIIAGRHPEYKFSTLAYQYGSTPPTGVEIADNLMIKWCIMSSYGRNDYSAPISDCESKIATQQYNEILGWSKLSDNIFVWDYVTNFFNYLLPFPCFSAMSGNIKLLRDCNVMGVLTLGSHNNRGFADYLKANYAAHLLWDADTNATELIGKFLTVYFGKDSAKYILKMYHDMENNIVGDLCIYDFTTSHNNDYLSLESLNSYYESLNLAFNATNGNETYLKRLRFEKLSLLYFQISLNYGTEQELQAAKAEFAELCDEFGIVTLNELGTVYVSDFVK